MAALEFVGSHIVKRAERCLLDKEQSIVLVAPPSHGKTTLLRDLAELARRRQIPVCWPTDSWPSIMNQIGAWEKHHVLKPRKGVVMLDDMDVHFACNRFCKRDIASMVRELSSRLSLAMCMSDGLHKKSQIRGVVCVPTTPVQEPELVSFAELQWASGGRVAAIESKGSFPKMVSLMRGCQPQQDEVRRCASEDVRLMLTTGADMRTAESMLHSHGGHMFADTLCHDAGLCCDTRSYLSALVRCLHCPPEYGHGSLCRAMVWSQIARTATHVPTMFTNSLALSNARSQARKKAGASARCQGLCAAELAWAR